MRPRSAPYFSVVVSPPNECIPEDITEAISPGRPYHRNSILCGARTARTFQYQRAEQSPRFVLSWPSRSKQYGIPILVLKSTGFHS
eukprot:COSAG02_NODE_573_length_20153_cov_11.609305_9_plen_86_part_00